MPLSVGTGAGNKILTAVFVNTPAGQKPLDLIYVGTGAGNKVIFSALAASASPSSVSGSGTAGSPIQTAISSVSVTGGTGSYSYLWTQTGGAVMAPTAATAAATRFLATPPTPQVRVATWICTVTDTGTGQTTDTNVVTATLTAT